MNTKFMQVNLQKSNHKETSVIFKFHYFIEIF